MTLERAGKYNPVTLKALGVWFIALLAAVAAGSGVPADACCDLMVKVEAPATACPGASIDAHAVILSGNPENHEITYVWTQDGVTKTGFTMPASGSTEICVTATDTVNGCVATACATVKACSLEIDGAGTLEVGCDSESTPNYGWYHAIVPDGCPLPTWSAGSPLEVFPHNPETEPSEFATIRANAPSSGCEQTATVTASAGGCTATKQVLVKAVGPFSFEQLGAITESNLDGSKTYFELQLPHPPGCTEFSAAFGSVAQRRLRFCVNGCPPTDTTITETVSSGDPCACDWPVQSSTNGPSGLGCIDIADNYGVLGCSCFEEGFRFGHDCTMRQQYSIGGCVVNDQCLHWLRDSPTSTCVGLADHIYPSAPVNDDCACQ